MLKILFLCTGNSCRSQMAEGWTRQLKGDQIKAYSAGTEPGMVNPLAVSVMAEKGVDITRQRSKHIDELRGIEFDYVVTLCDQAQRNCPDLPGNAKKVHVGFDDPPKLAFGSTAKQRRLIPYRRVRDEIKAFVEKLPESLG
jgi:arsenate reductase (thioredoxin)